ncbi:hypothetical protein AGMMS4956_10960 [Bacteroidia bacterium]|nr:hypothetical protein AGMMS4956_10960 [Bacteroidia bacterium]
MKKLFVLIVCVVAFGISAVVVSSCKKDDAKAPTCKCTFDNGYGSWKETIDLSDEDDRDGWDLSAKIKTCDDLEEELEDGGSYESVSCK